MHTIWQDVRYGLRLLLKSPGFAVTAILTLALGIGASTAIFSVVYAALLKPLPYPQPDRIVRVWQVDDKGYKSNISDPNFEDLRDGSRSFSSLAEYSSSITETVSLGRDVFRMNGTFVSKQFFDAMGIQPVVGRGFLPEETRLGGSPVVLVATPFGNRLSAEIRTSLQNASLSKANRIRLPAYFPRASISQAIQTSGFRANNRSATPAAQH